MPYPARRLTQPLLVALTVLSASCANMGQTQTGFLGDYSGLQEAPEREAWGVPDDILLETTPAFEAVVSGAGVQAVMVDEVVYLPVEGAKYVASEASARALTEWSTNRMRQELGKRFEIVDEAGPGTVTVRMAITDLNPQNLWINIVGVIVAVPPDMGGISGELEVVDSVSGARLVAMTATREGTPFHILEAFTKHGHACHSVKKWGRDLGRLLQGD